MAGTDACVKQQPFRAEDLASPSETQPQHNDDPRITLWHEGERRKICGSAAPKASNLKQYLAEHPGWTVYNKLNEHSTERPSASSSEESPYVTVWEPSTGRVYSGRSAPLRKNLKRYFREHPLREVYHNQNRAPDYQLPNEMYEYVTMWDPERRVKITGAARPRRNRVESYMTRHPGHEEYVNQDGRASSVARNRKRKRERAVAGSSKRNKGGVLAALGAMSSYGAGPMITQTKQDSHNASIPEAANKTPALGQPEFFETARPTDDEWPHIDETEFVTELRHDCTVVNPDANLRSTEPTTSVRAFCNGSKSTGDETAYDFADLIADVDLGFSAQDTADSPEYPHLPIALCSASRESASNALNLLDIRSKGGLEDSVPLGEPHPAVCTPWGPQEIPDLASPLVSDEQRAAVALPVWSFLQAGLLKSDKRATECSRAHSRNAQDEDDADVAWPRTDAQLSMSEPELMNILELEDVLQRSGDQNLTGMADIGFPPGHLAVSQRLADSCIGGNLSILGDSKDTVRHARAEDTFVDVPRVV